MMPDREGTGAPAIPLHKPGALEGLPRLPQIPRLASCSKRLLAEPDVSALWLRGSFARKQADPLSDLDLEIHLSGQSWDAGRVHGVLSPGLVGLRESTRAGVRVFEGVFEDGLIIDLDIHAARALTPPAEPQRELLLHRYWVSVLKARKLVLRDEFLIAQQGLAYQRSLLFRALAERAGVTVEDPVALSIHALRRLLGRLDPPPHLDLTAALGWPCRTWDEFLCALDKLNLAMAAIETTTSALGRVARRLWARRDYVLR